MSAAKLPDYQDPPVAEIVAAVQFSPVGSFRIPEIIRLDEAFGSDWSLFEAREALEAIVESPPGVPPAGRFGLGFGSPPQRAMFSGGDGRWLLQVQHDRVALNETRMPTSRPSARTAIPELRRQLAKVGPALGQDSLNGCPSTPELVELVYVNHIDESRGFTSWGDLGELLVGIGSSPGTARMTDPEGMQVAWSFPLNESGAFVGRFRAEVVPAATGGIQLQLNSRRYVQGRDPFAVLEQCHEDIVCGFDDMTTPKAHEIWGKLR